MPPTNPPPQSSPFRLIADAIRTRVASSLRVNAQFIRLAASDDYKLTEDEPLFVVVRAFQPRPRQDGGAGRLSRIVSRRVRCYVYTRSGSDVYGGDEFALLDTSSVPGHFAAEEMVLNALDDWYPKPTSGAGVLTPEPLHTLEDAGPPERKPENEEGLVRSYLDFEVVYVLAINPTEPAP